MKRRRCRTTATVGHHNVFPTVGLEGSTVRKTQKCFNALGISPFAFKKGHVEQTPGPLGQQPCDQRLHVWREDFAPIALTL